MERTVLMMGKLHVSVQWFIVLVVVTLVALMISVVADKLGSPGLGATIVTGIVAMWAVLVMSGVILIVTLWNKTMFKMGADTAIKAKEADDRGDAQLTRSLADIFRLGATAGRQLGEPPARPMGPYIDALPPLRTLSLPVGVDESWDVPSSSPKEDGN